MHVYRTVFGGSGSRLHRLLCSSVGLEVGSSAWHEGQMIVLEVAKEGGKNAKLVRHKPRVFVLAIKSPFLGFPWLHLATFPPWLPFIIQWNGVLVFSWFLILGLAVGLIYKLMCSMMLKHHHFNACFFGFTILKTTHHHRRPPGENAILRLGCLQARHGPARAGSWLRRLATIRTFSGGSSFQSLLS